MKDKNLQRKHNVYQMGLDLKKWIYNYTPSTKILELQRWTETHESSNLNK